MKNIFTISFVLLAFIVAGTSCKKVYDCKCDIKTVTLDNGDTVKSTTSLYPIKATKEDAEDACKYYETEEKHLGREAVVYHYCNATEAE